MHRAHYVFVPFIVCSPNLQYPSTSLKCVVNTRNKFGGWMSAVLFDCRVQKRKKKKKSCALFFLNNAVPLCVVIMPLFLYLVTMLTEALSTLASVTLQRLFAGATFRSNFFEVYRRLLLFVGCLCNAAAVSSAKCDKKGTGGRAYLSSFFFSHPYLLLYFAQVSCPFAKRQVFPVALQSSSR